MIKSSNSLDMGLSKYSSMPASSVFCQSHQPHGQKGLINLHGSRAIYGLSGMEHQRFPSVPMPIIPSIDTKLLRYMFLDTKSAKRQRYIKATGSNYVPSSMRSPAPFVYRVEAFLVYWRSQETSIPSVSAYFRPFQRPFHMG